MKEIKKRINEMKIDEHIEINHSCELINDLVKDLQGTHRVFALDSDRCMVFKYEPKTEKPKKSILDAIENLGLCKDVIVAEPISTVRGIVYRFNKKHDRKITVKDVNGECVLSEDFMSRKTYTEKDYDNVRVQAEEIVNKVKAAIDSNDVWEEDII